MQQASEMVEYAKEAITEALVGPPPPPLTPRLQPFKSPRYKSAHGKAFLPSEAEQTRVAVLHTGLTQQLHDAYGKTAIVVPEIGHLDHKRPFLEFDGPISARNAAPSLPGDSPTSGSQSARGPLVFSKHTDQTPRRLTTPGVTPRTKDWGSDALCSRRGASYGKERAPPPQSPFHPGGSASKKQGRVPLTLTFLTFHFAQCVRPNCNMSGACNEK